MDFHKEQDQHRVSQVYLKPFGHKRHGCWYVTVLEISKGFTEEKLIEEFTVVRNEFDYLSEDYQERRHFEDTSSYIEGMYPNVIKALKKSAELTKIHEDVLRHFIASLLCRSEFERRFFRDLLEDTRTRDRFIDEVTMFDEESRSDLKLAMSVLGG